ncbi:MAG: ion channel [Jhaorihella sp.]
MTGGPKQRVRQLYQGHGKNAVRFRYALILFDVLTIVFFILTTPLPGTPLLHALNFVIALVILADFSARLWIAADRWHTLRQIYTLADAVVIVVLVLDPFLSHHFAFLRILRGLRLIHSYHLLRDLRRHSRFFRRNEDALIAATNLFVFVFLTASAVHALFFKLEEGAAAYVDALYFTVATLTTTGYGDITPVTPAQKTFSVFIMVIGFALFVQLARALFQPQKVRYKCPECGLLRHDIDAVHCKHCGTQLKIETPGAD